MFSFKLGNSQNELLRRQKCTASVTRHRLFLYIEKKEEKKKQGKRKAHEIYSTIIAGRRGEERGLLVVPFTQNVRLYKATKASVCRYATGIRQEHGVQHTSKLPECFL